MKKQFTLFVLMGLFHFANAQTSFTRTYGTPANEYGQNAILTRDGGYALLIRETDSFSIDKTDSLGNIQWQKTYPINNGSSGYNASKLIQTTDDGFAVIGGTSLPAYNSGQYSSGIVIKFDSVGNIQWHTSLYGSSYGENNATDIAQNTNGEYICAATIQYQADFGGVNYYPTIIKLSSTGVIQWNHAINNSNGSGIGVIAIGTTYYITGNVNGVYGYMNYGGNAFMAEYNNSGSQVWLRNYTYAPVASNNADRGAKIKPMTGGFAIAGQQQIGSYYNAFIIKTDTGGNEIWHTLYGSSTDNKGFSDLVIANDGNIVATGAFDTVLVVQKVNSSTNVTMWNQPYYNGNGNSINLCSNNDLLIFGSTNNHGAGGYDAWLIRANSLGTQGCSQIVYDTTRTQIYDTTRVTVYDTLIRNVNDTVFTHLIVYDTTRTQIFDTITTNQTVYDTVTHYIAVTDTLIINANLTGILPPNNTNELKVYPNPANTDLYIDCGNYATMSGYTIKITNSIGQTVFSTAITQQQYDINLSSWSGHGVYVLTISDPSNTVISTKEIVIQ